MRKHRKRFWKKQGGYWFCYLGNHKWFAPHLKGKRNPICYYSKKHKTFYSPAPKNSKGLKGLKSWWKGYRKKKYGK